MLATSDHALVICEVDEVRLCMKEMPSDHVSLIRNAALACALAKNAHLRNARLQLLLSSNMLIA